MSNRQGSVKRPCVVMISANFFPYMGGAEKQALELSKALQRLGWRVVVLTRRLSGLKDREDVEGVSVLRLTAFGRGLMNSLGFMASCFLWLMMHAGEYEVIHAHLAGSPALSAAAAGKLFGKRVIVKLGGGRGIGEIALSSRTWAGRLKLKLLSRLRPQFVCVTQDLLDELEEHGVQSSGAAVVPNGVDVRRFSPPSPHEKRELRRAAGWPEGLSFLYVGRLAPEKQLDLFLQVFAEALRDTGAPRLHLPGQLSSQMFARAQAHVALVGSGPEETALKGMIQSLSLESHVRFYDSVTDIDRFYKLADVFVLPSVSEGLSNALLEAMSSGLAVLASRVGGTREAVRDEVSGLLFDAGNSAEMKAQLERFLKNPGLAETLGRRAREDIMARFDLDAVAREYVKLYRATSAGISELDR